MGRRPTKIKVDVTWETTDDPNAILPWVRATEILLRAKARRDVYLEKLEKEDPTTFLVECLISFARHQEEIIFCTDGGVLFGVEVPLDMFRLKRGFLYTLERTQRTRSEPLNALTNVIERYLNTKSLIPTDYAALTRNAPYTLALLDQFLAHRSHDLPLHDTGMQ